MDKPTLELLASKVREFRELRGWSQQELAVKAGVGITTVSKLERGTTVRPHPRVVRSLADALGVSIERLLSINSGDFSELIEEFLAEGASMFDITEEEAAWFRANADLKWIGPTPDKQTLIALLQARRSAS